MNQEKLKESINEHNEKILSQITDYSLPTSKLFKNLVGLKIDKLEVIKFAGRRKRPNIKSDSFYFWCKCECGNIKIFNSQDLCKTTDYVKSCGCLYDKADIIKYARLYKPNIYHAYISGDENKKILYNRFRAMYNRCCNPSHKNFSEYGGRGIKICDEWSYNIDGFKNFCEWALSNGFSKELTIDRIDVNLGYSPRNCRWVDYNVQSNNTRATIYGVIGNYALPLSIWAVINNIDDDTIRGRIYAGWNYKDAFFTPTGEKRGKYNLSYYVPDEYMIYNKYEEFLNNGKIINCNINDLTIHLVFDKNIHYLI